MAVSNQDNQATLMVVNPENKLEERIVQVGIETPNKVEVLSGLRENELVVVGSRGQLKPGQLVMPKIIQLAEVREEH